MTSRWVGRQESSEARGGAGRRSAPPGEGGGTNSQRQILASPLTPHVRYPSVRLGSPGKTRPRQDEAVAISHGGPRFEFCRAARAMQEKYVQRGLTQQKHQPCASAKRKSEGIQDLAEPVWMEHQPQDAPFFLLALSSCDRKPDCLAHGGARKKNIKTADEIFNPLSTSSPCQEYSLGPLCPSKGCVCRRP